PAQPAEVHLQLVGQPPLLFHLLLDTKQAVLRKEVLKVFAERRLAVRSERPLFVSLICMFDDEDREPASDWVPGEDGPQRESGFGFSLWGDDFHGLRLCRFRGGLNKGIRRGPG